MLKSLRFLLVLALLGACAALGACNGDDDNVNVSPPPVDEDAAPTGSPPMDINGDE